LEVEIEIEADSRRRRRRSLRLCWFSLSAVPAEIEAERRRMVRIEKRIFCSFIEIV
jgi:hypothetical protein